MDRADQAGDQAIRLGSLGGRNTPHLYYTKALPHLLCGWAFLWFRVIYREMSKGGRASRPPLQQNRINVGESPTLLWRSIAQTSPTRSGTRCLLDKTVYRSIGNFRQNDDEPFLLIEKSTTAPTKGRNRVAGCVQSCFRVGCVPKLSQSL